MKQHCTTLLSLASGALFLFTTACTTSQVSQQSSEQKTFLTKQLSDKVENTEAVAAAQTSVSAEQPFSASETYTQATTRNHQSTDELTATNTAQDSKTAFRSLREQVKTQKMNPVKKALVTTALKKMEKMQTKLEVKAAKKNKGIPSEYKTPVIIGVIGLALVIIGAFGIWPLYVLGGLALTAAVIWILLIVLEVI